MTSPTIPTKYAQAIVGHIFQRIKCNCCNLLLNKPTNRQRVNADQWKCLFLRMFLLFGNELHFQNISTIFISAILILLYTLTLWLLFWLYPYICIDNELAKLVSLFLHNYPAIRRANATWAVRFCVAADKVAASKIYGNKGRLSVGKGSARSTARSGVTPSNSFNWVST